MHKSDVPDCLRDQKGLIAWTSVNCLFVFYQTSLFNGRVSFLFLENSQTALLNEFQGTSDLCACSIIQTVTDLTLRGRHGLREGKHLFSTLNLKS